MADDRYPAIPLPAPGASGILNPNAGVGFFFAGPEGAASHEELLRRRAMLEARAKQQRGFPKNIGEGLTALGEAFGDRMEANRLSAQERVFGAAEDQRIGGMRGAPGPGPAVAPRPSAELLDPAVNDTRNRLTALEVGRTRPTEPGATSLPVTATGGLVSDDEPIWNARSGAIGGIESGGRYDTVSKAPTKYGHALGKYGVVEANVGPWTQAALGQPLTPAQFLQNPQAQDAVFRHRFGQYVNQFGEEGAARAWFGGPGNVRNVNATDAYGRLSVGTYGQDYLRRLRGGQPSGDPGDAGGDVGSTATIDTATGAEPNPRTPTDIRPAPRAGAAPVYGPGMRVVNSTLPSQSPVPPQTEQEMDEPGPKPVMPDRPAYSPRQLEALKIMEHRGSSDYAKAVAKHYFDMDEKERGLISTQGMEQYRNDREAWEKRDADFKKFKREAPDRYIDMLIKRGQFEKAQIETAKMIHERDGGAWDAAVEKAKLEVAQAQRTLTKPEHLDTAGTRMIAPYDPGKGTYGPYTLAPGAPAPKEDLTEAQSKGVQNVIRTMADLEKLDTSLKGGVALTGKLDHAIEHSPVPHAVSNMGISDEYRQARDAVSNWGAAFLTHVSGAAVSPSEAFRNLPAFVPRPGDGPEELAAKAQRRRDMTQGIAATTGSTGRAMVEKFQNDMFEAERAKPPVKISGPEEGKALPAGRRIITPDGREGVVPKRKIF